MHGYARARLYFDVMGGMVYKVLHTGSTCMPAMKEQTIPLKTGLKTETVQYQWKSLRQYGDILYQNRG